MSVEALRYLAEKVKAGTLEYNDCCELAVELQGYHGRAFEAYQGLLDGAKALHEAVLQNSPLDIVLTSGYSRVSIYSGPKAPFHARNESVARAWLLAILKALIAQEESK